MKKMDISDHELLILIHDVEQNGMMTAPKRLKDNILQESQNIAVKTEVAKKKLSSNMKLFLYGLKITAAVSVSFVLLFAMNISNNWMPKDGFAHQYTGEKISGILNETSDEVGNFMNKISNNMIIRIGEKK